MVNRAAIELQSDQLEEIEKGATVIVEIPLSEVSIIGCQVTVDLGLAALTHERVLLLTIRKRREAVQ